MAHRGRLNVLANIMGKSPREIFREFEDVDPELYCGRGDVKYHLGHSSRLRHARAGSKVHLSLCFNPSHLEYVNPVALGRVRAKQDRVGDRDARREHGAPDPRRRGVRRRGRRAGDAEPEPARRATRRAARMHVVVNNQIGFTTPPSRGAARRTYATDVAKMLQIPIFHVNGEDPEAVAQVVRLAMDFRARVPARRGDRHVLLPPLRPQRERRAGVHAAAAVRAIAERKSVREGYLEHLLKLGGVTREEADAIAVERREQLERELGEARQQGLRARRRTGSAATGRATAAGPRADVPEVDTGVDASAPARAARSRRRELPEDFHPHPQDRAAARERGGRWRDGERPLDWGAAEALAFATLVAEGHRVRLTGQDTERGTFSQRHAVLHDVEDGTPYMPLCARRAGSGAGRDLQQPALRSGRAGLRVRLQPRLPRRARALGSAVRRLRERGAGDHRPVHRQRRGQVAAAERPRACCCRTASRAGAGALERAARALPRARGRRQHPGRATRPRRRSTFTCCGGRCCGRWRKPLDRDDAEEPAAAPAGASSARRVSRRAVPARHCRTHRGDPQGRRACCSARGKVYYDLEKRAQRARARGRGDRAPRAALSAARRVPRARPSHRFADGTPVVWVQEEPENMGAWRYLHARFGEHAVRALSVLRRRAAPSRPARRPARQAATSSSNTSCSIGRSAAMKPQHSAPFGPTV